MDMTQFLTDGLGLVLVLAVALAIAWAGGQVAGRLGQPKVLGEVVAGLLCGPVAVAVLGQHGFDTLIEGGLLDGAKTVAEIGLVLFLAGEAAGLRTGGGVRSDRRATTLVAAGAFTAPALCGLLLAWWASGDPVIRGQAPPLAFWLMVAVSLSITAVPVLARILAEQRVDGRDTGRLALAAAIVIDSVTWLLLLVAVGSTTGSMSGFLRSMAVLCCAVLVALGVAAGLRMAAARSAARRWPKSAAVVLGGTAVALALTLEHLGMTLVIGAVLFGLATPGGPDSAWLTPVRLVTRLGRRLVPIYFVVTGITVLTGGLPTPTVSLMVATVLLGVVGKLVGGYFGARLAGRPRPNALRMGALMNTRGLTEIVIAQAGYTAGILTAPLFIAMIVLAVVTTALTGPLLRLVDRRFPDSGGGAPVDSVPDQPDMQAREGMQL